MWLYPGKSIFNFPALPNASLTRLLWHVDVNQSHDATVIINCLCRSSWRRPRESIHFELVGQVVSGTWGPEWPWLLYFWVVSYVICIEWTKFLLIREDEIKSCKIASSLVGAAPWLNCRVPGWSCDGSVIWSAKAWNTFNYKVKSMNLKFCLIFVTNSKYDHDFPETWYWV